MRIELREFDFEIEKKKRLTAGVEVEVEAWSGGPSFPPLQFLY